MSDQIAIYNNGYLVKKDGQTNGWTDKLMDRQTDEQTDWWALYNYEQTDRQTKTQIYEQTDGRKHKYMNRQSDE